MIAQDRFSEIDPVYWYFWIGEFMVLLVMLAPGGVLGLPARLRQLVAGIIVIMLVNTGFAALYDNFIGEPPDTRAADPLTGIIPIYWYIWIGELAVLSLILAPGWPLRLPARVRQFANGIRSGDETQLLIVRGAATAAILIALNLWIALDSARGALLSRWHCVLWPGSTCMGATWLIPLLLWLGIILLGALHAARRRAAGKA
jgi:hypothetical protein